MERDLIAGIWLALGSVIQNFPASPVTPGNQTVPADDEWRENCNKVSSPLTIQIPVNLIYYFDEFIDDSSINCICDMNV